jgi:hypothetical protein
MSMITMSGARAAAISKASFPFSAASTVKSSACRKSASIARLAASSSTTSACLRGPV